MKYPVKKWGEVLCIISGKNQKAVVDSKGQYPIYGSGGVIGYANNYLCEAGTTIIGRKGTINHPIYVNERFWNVDTAFGLFPGQELLPKYLFYFCQSFSFKALDKSTTIPSLAKCDLLNIEMPVPPISEQERVVARIEELFSQLDANVNELKTAKERLTVYRQAVLNSCIGEGQFQPISECIESIGQGWSPKCARMSVKDDNAWAVIATTAVQPMKFAFEENKRLPDDLPPRKQHELKVGDILITRAGPRSRCGVCCMVRKTKKHLLNCDKVYCLKVNGAVVLPEYLEAVLNAPDFQKKIAFCKTGGNDSGVNLTQSRFLSIEVPVPNITTQNAILSNIETGLSVCESIEKSVDTALQQAEALRQSILKKAFEGKLV